MLNVLFACISGLFYALSFPDFNLWPAIFIFLLPLMFLAEKHGKKQIFILGLIAGIVAWTGIMYWAAYIMEIYGELPLWISSAFLLLLCTYLGIYFAVFALSLKYFLRSRWSFLILPGIWISLEFIRSWLISGFPWELAGYALYDWNALTQSAEFSGVYILSGLVVMANVALYKAARKDFLPIAATTMIFLIFAGWGHYRLNSFRPEGPSMKTAVIQANIPQEVKWNPDMVTPTIEIYSRLTREALKGSPEIIIWPETACNFYLFREWIPTSHIVSLSRETNTRMLIGSPAAGDDKKYYNRVWDIKSGEINGTYDKTHLVPFGEYLPLASVIEPIFGKLTQGVSDFSKSEKLAPLGETGVLICFEAVLPTLARKLCMMGSSVLITVSNDAWFKKWSTNEQHLRMATFRCIENRRYMALSVNHGISAVVDPFGRILKRLELEKEGVIVENIKKLEGKTFYMRFGSVIAGLWAVLSIIASLTLFRRNDNPD